ncbi:hypothetical protein M446_1237 [Methylobacterium sp. 4-46]|nr:hypothetical protein M446_1237 [Methylobacterium sp. 4-46]
MIPVSERRSCGALGSGRSGIRCRSTKLDQAPLRMRICNLAKSWVRYGSFWIHILLRRESWRISHKRVCRLYGSKDLSLRFKRLGKVGAKVIAHSRYTVFHLAEVAVPRDLFRRMLNLIDGLRPKQVARC